MDFSAGCCERQREGRGREEGGKREGGLVRRGLEALKGKGKGVARTRINKREHDIQEHLDEVRDVDDERCAEAFGVVVLCS